jgi:hypothetical protein
MSHILETSFIPSSRLFTESLTEFERTSNSYDDATLFLDLNRVGSRGISSTVAANFIMGLTISISRRTKKPAPTQNASPTEATKKIFLTHIPC